LAGCFEGRSGRHRSRCDTEIAGGVIQLHHAGLSPNPGGEASRPDAGRLTSPSSPRCALLHLGDLVFALVSVVPLVAQEDERLIWAECGDQRRGTETEAAARVYVVARTKGWVLCQAGAIWRWFALEE
jgi:hypothetical protein